MIQTPMVGLVAVGLWLMVDDVGAADGGGAMVCAWLARAAIFVFAAYVTVLDASGGSGLGRTIVVVESLKLDEKQLDVVKMLLNKMWIDPLVGGGGSTINPTGPGAAVLG